LNERRTPLRELDGVFYLFYFISPILGFILGCFVSINLILSILIYLLFRFIVGWIKYNVSEFYHLCCKQE
ncbi:hypothetical protein, partial [Avibacterium gallinarum]